MASQRSGKPICTTARLSEMSPVSVASGNSFQHVYVVSMIYMLDGLLSDSQLVPRCTVGIKRVGNPQQSGSVLQDLPNSKALHLVRSMSNQHVKFLPAESESHLPSLADFVSSFP